MTQTFLRIADVCRVTGLPRATIYEMVSKGTFPKQVRLSPRTVGWIESEILKWQQALIAERDGVILTGVCFERDSTVFDARGLTGNPLPMRRA